MTYENLNHVKFRQYLYKLSLDIKHIDARKLDKNHLSFIGV